MSSASTAVAVRRWRALVAMLAHPYVTNFVCARDIAALACLRSASERVRFAPPRLVHARARRSRWKWLHCAVCEQCDTIYYDIVPMALWCGCFYVVCGLHASRMLPQVRAHGGVVHFTRASTSSYCTIHRTATTTTIRLPSRSVTKATQSF